jgi:hypothetical protein
MLIANRRSLTNRRGGTRTIRTGPFGRPFSAGLLVGVGLHALGPLRMLQHLEQPCQHKRESLEQVPVKI